MSEKTTRFAAVTNDRPRGVLASRYFVSKDNADNDAQVRNARAAQFGLDTRYEVIAFEVDLSEKSVATNLAPNGA